MFNNSSNIDASHSTFSEVHRDQYYNSRPTVQGNQTVNTVVHGNQIFQASNSSLEALQKASAFSAAYDSVERHPAATCLEGTRVQLLARLTEWIEDTNEKPICWLNGRPGSGKSAISQTVAEKYAGQKRLAASFFFSRRDIERRTTRHFFPTIATQLLSSLPSIRPAVIAALEQDYMIPSKVLREQMQKLLLEPLSSVQESLGAPLLIVVDALDECDDPRLVVELVSLLAHLIRNTSLPLRLLITSRSESWLQSHFYEPRIAPLTVALEIHAFSAEDDIRSFLHHSLDEVYNQHYQLMQDLPGPWPSPDDLDRIVSKASGLFIFALTVVKFVGDRMHNPVQRLQAILEDKALSGDTAYADLDALYRDAISVFPDADVVRLILGVVYCMSIPLSIPALHRLLDRSDVDARVVIPALGSVLLASEDGKQPIQFYHASFRDFLVSPQRSRNYSIDPTVYHRLMAQLCFQTMVKSLKRDMCGIGDPSKLNSEVEGLQERRQAVFDEALLYACRYWLLHLTQLPSAGGVYELLLNAMRDFCSTALLHWIEALSILNELENAIMMLRASINWVQSYAGAPKEIILLLEDAERLILLYKEPISQSALHVYHTAIAFAPSSSLLYKKYKHEEGGTFTITFNQNDEWLPYRYAIDLDPIYSVAFSPRGDVVATAGVNQGVQLWNTVTGGNVASLGDRTSPSLLVRFSASGAFVATAFENGTVAVWDPSVGREHLKDEGPHTGAITSLEFSPDSLLLASGSRDQSIQLWSMDSAQRLYKLVCHEGPVTSLAFTSDSQRLCSGSEDNLLIFWDTKSGKVIRGMMGHRGPITSLAVSRDGNMIVTGSQDKSVKIWDSHSGSCARTFSEGHEGIIRSVAFCDDDKWVISACDKTIFSRGVVSSRKSPDVTIWDLGQFYRSALENTPIWQAKVLGWGVPAPLWKKLIGSVQRNVEIFVAYSSQSPTLAFSLATYIWCGELGSLPNSPPLHVSRSNTAALAISPDGTRVAAATSVGSLEILETTVPRKTWDEEMKKDNALPLLSANAVVASPDGDRYLVNSQLAWFLVDSQLQLIKKIYFGFANILRDVEFKTPVFSGDSSIFAWGLSDILQRDNKTSVRVFDSVTGQPKTRINGLKTIQSFALAPNGALIACGSEGAIQVCDVAGGTKRTVSVADNCSITALAFSHDSQELLSGSKEGIVQLWDPSMGECKATFGARTPASMVKAVTFAPVGGMAVAGHEDGNVRLLSPSELKSYDLIPSGQAVTHNINLLKFSDDCLTLTCRAGDRAVSTWAIPAHPFQGDEENAASSATCHQKEVNEGKEQKDDEREEVKDETKEVMKAEEAKEEEKRAKDEIHEKPLHLIAQADKHDVFDNMLRSTYVIRKDGWLFRGDERLFWIPQHLRPAPGREASFAALNDRVMILSHEGHPLFLNLHDGV
ncbi:hypothetical protein HYDPIDRAFT_29157 [Hydnomerulius pinastri MD-312]|uniref:NACHT domain-containing protein n=1 Tax=Hydnomerulius pinastri MD-312 TaxID=994086 RepID=A0A0C9WF12_9AGAM|nr:hypothetical protein HYDPIDRAFT_29157 [Hydnomerulius pinastri MD-312]